MRTGDSLRQENLQQFGRLVTPKKFVARVPAVYLTSAEGTILAFLRFLEINKLQALKAVCGFKSRPGYHSTCIWNSARATHSAARCMILAPGSFKTPA